MCRLQTRNEKTEGVSVNFGPEFAPLNNVNAANVSINVTGQAVAHLEVGGHFRSVQEMVCRYPCLVRARIVVYMPDI